MKTAIAAAAISCLVGAAGFGGAIALAGGQHRSWSCSVRPNEAHCKKTQTITLTVTAPGETVTEAAPAVTVTDTTPAVTVTTPAVTVTTPAETVTVTKVKTVVKRKVCKPKRITIFVEKPSPTTHPHGGGVTG